MGSGQDKNVLEFGFVNPAEQVQTSVYWYWISGNISEEGVKKDPATVSYFFITAGMASHVLLVTSVLLRKGRSRGGLLVLCGQNPMIAYTAAGYVVVPLLVFADRAVALPWLWGQCGCVMGVGRGVIVTLLMMLFTAAFTRSKIFWRT